ncbi:MAG: hypothetical protein MJ053_05515 [Elusimicrobiaceae bacterium]|nr:hypothetical protein [Elusimicrobiaceae bacterium]
MTYQKMIVALDIGTSGCRAAAVCMDGTLAAHHYVPLTPVRKAAGLSEYEASALLQASLQALQAVLDKVGPEQVASLAVASQRSTVVLFDKTSGQAVAPVLTWEDGRSQQQAAQAPISQEEVHALTGLYKTPFFSASKIAWSLQAVPQAAQTLHTGNLLASPVASYLIWNFTKGAVFATDYTLAQRTLLFDITTLSWSETLCRAFGITGEILPQVFPTCADYGSYTYRGVSSPITVCSGDQQAAAAYFNLQPHESLINYGTGAFWLYHTGEKPVFLPGMLTSLAAGGDKASYLLEGPVNCAASALLWLRAQGITFEDEKIDELCHLTTEPVLFLPALGGLGAPYWDYHVSAAVDNLSPRTCKADWVAGVLRAVALRLTDIATYLRVHGYDTSGKIRVSGGLSRIGYLVSFQADMLQQNLYITEQADATVLGAALLAARGGKMRPEFEQPQQLVSPAVNEKAAKQVYRQWQTFVARVRQK